jgi:hypothetical protein
MNQLITWNLPAPGTVFILIAVGGLLSVTACKKGSVEPPPVVPSPNTPVKPNNPPSDPNKPTALIYTGLDGKLAYNTYANEGETDKVNIIPDFSNAGYKGGGVPLPVIPVKKTLGPQPGDNRLRIQQAIDELEALPADANGYRGALLLQAGIYEIDGTLMIEKDGVVLRGEGQGLNGTILKATKTAQHTLIIIRGSGGAGETGDRPTITTAFVPTGSKSFAVSSVTSFSVGSEIAVVKTPNQAWIDLVDMAQFDWTASSYKRKYERKIVAISGNTITLNAPIVDPIQPKYGGGYITRMTSTGRIENCGVENLRLVSVYSSDYDELHAWKGVELQRVENCWVKKVTAQYFGYACVSIDDQSTFNTVEECAMIDIKSKIEGGRRYSFNLEGDACFNLFQRCYADGGRHDYVTGSQVPGPNVFLDCYAANPTSDLGPHHRWSTGLLFDNIYGGMMRVQNRGSSGSGHGWAGAQTLFYNCKSYKDDIKVDSPPGAKNWGIGCIGVKQSGAGYWESWGTHVTPRSLYLAQLKDRLGDNAVANITTLSQRIGTIYTALSAWKGEGNLN